MKTVFNDQTTGADGSLAMLQVADSDAQTAELRQQVDTLTQQLQDSKDTEARTSSEYDLLTQQLSGKSSSAERVPDSPPGSPSRKLQATLEELADLRYAVLCYALAYCSTPDPDELTHDMLHGCSLHRVMTCHAVMYMFMTT